MPTIQRGDATIDYEERGSGPPLLLLAPGGLNSPAQGYARAHPEGRARVHVVRPQRVLDS